MTFNTLLETVQELAKTTNIKVSDWTIWGNSGTTYDAKMEDHYISVFYTDGRQTYNIIGSKKSYLIQDKEATVNAHRHEVLEQFKEILAKNGEAKTD